MSRTEFNNDALILLQKVGFAIDDCCPECYNENELALAALRAGTPQTTNTAVASSSSKPTRKQPLRLANKKDGNTMMSSSPQPGASTSSRLRTPTAISTPPPPPPPPKNDNNKLLDLVHQLSDKVESQSKLITSLTNKLSFVMSILGIVDDEFLPVPSSPPQDEAATNTNPAYSKSKTWSQIVASKPADTAFNNLEVVKNISTKYNNSIIAAMYADQQENARRARTFIVHGLPDIDNSSDKDKIKDLCEREFSLDLDIAFDKRLGKTSQNGKPRPLLVGLQTQDVAEHIVKSARQLRQSTDQYIRNQVYINANLTKAKARMEYERRQSRRHRPTPNAVIGNDVNAMSNNDQPTALTAAHDPSSDDTSPHNLASLPQHQPVPPPPVMTSGRPSSTSTETQSQ